MQHDLKFKRHIHEITTKAYNRVNLIFRSFMNKNINFQVKLFTTYVRPVLEYNSCVWSPHQICDINLVERVQRYFTRRITPKDTPYHERLTMCGLETLEERWLRADLKEVYRMLSSGEDFSPFFLPLISRTRGHNKRLKISYSIRKDCSKYFFAHRAIKIWNSLPDDIVNSVSLPVFRRKLVSVDLSADLKIRPD
jgi:hypothetical protein